jgi:hypothetical protein
LNELVSQFKTVILSKGSPVDAKLYVTQATVDDIRKALLQEAKSWVQPHYVIGTDKELAKSLLEELEYRRFIEPGKPGNDIAIVCEWDTEYGRRMLPTFKNAIAALRGVETDTSPSGSRADLHKLHLSHFTYLRGLDGKLPGEKDKEPSAKGDAAPAAEGANVEQPTAETGEGNSQIDYLRRLVGRMKANNKDFRAIGLLGSDVYDKLLLLKALRPSFPEAFFFTTDLDVRLLQPGDFANTHNLLIASHYGLSLHDALQGDTPPFRSGYDTSSYMGYLLAVSYALPEDETTSRLLPVWQRLASAGALPEPAYREPRIYEVGRSGAYELTFSQDNVFSARNAREERTGLKMNILCIAAVGVLAGILILPLSSRWRRFVSFPYCCGRRVARMITGARKSGDATPPAATSAEGDWLCAFGWMAFVLSVVLALAMYRAHASPNGEPVAWFEGLSVWPTEVLRWLAALLSLFFIAQAYQKLVKRNQEIQSANKLADTPPVKTTSWRGWLWAEAVAAREMWFHWKPENPVLQVEWNRFREYGRTTHRWQPWRLPRRRGGRRTAASYFVRPSSAAARPFLGAGALGRIGSKRLSGQD